MAYNVVQDYSRGDAVNVLIPGWYNVPTGALVQMPMPQKEPDSETVNLENGTACIVLEPSEYAATVDDKDRVDRYVTCSNRGFFKVELMRPKDSKDLTDEAINSIVDLYFYINKEKTIKEFVLVAASENEKVKQEVKTAGGSLSCGCWAGRIVKVTTSGEPIVEFFKIPSKPAGN